MKLIFKPKNKNRIFRPTKLKFFKQSLYPKRSRSEWKLIDKNPFGDADKDRVPNWFDCKPLNRKKQDYTYYHGTSKKALKEIMKKGLQPKSEVYTETKPYTKKLTYATTDIDIAKERGGSGELDDSVILKIKSEKKYPTEGEFVGISYGNPKTFAITDTIAPEQLEIIEDLKEDLKD